MKIYIVQESTGDYDMSVTTAIRAYTTQEAAEKYVKELEEHNEHIEEIAIRNKTWDVTNDPEIDYQFTNLEDKWRLEYIRKNIPKYANLSSIYDDDFENDTFTDDEYDIINTYFSDDKEIIQSFREFMKKEGYSDEVIDATIEYNSKDSFTKDPYYNIDEIELFS